MVDAVTESHSFPSKAWLANKRRAESRAMRGRTRAVMGVIDLRISKAGLLFRAKSYRLRSEEFTAVATRSAALAGVLVFPHAHDAPSRRPEATVRVRIPTPIGF